MVETAKRCLFLIPSGAAVGTRVRVVIFLRRDPRQSPKMGVGVLFVGTDVVNYQALIDDR
jgi:hypothetical protein